MSHPARTVRRMSLLDFVFPSACAGCGRRGAFLCDGCARTLTLAPSGAPPPFVDEWVALFAYEGVARELTARVKYRNARAALPWFATMLANAVARRFDVASVDAITWAPTTNHRRRARGFDHAELLARRVARELRRPAHQFLVRTSIEAQTGRSYAARRAGPSFRSVRGAAGCVLLIDDVATTGATLRAAGRALRAGGTRCVLAATVARTPPPGAAGRRLGLAAYTPPR
jgi:predicted amidophosphoribosyltransferase